jgi:hypothetical protein
MTRDKALSITDQIKELLKNLAETENLKLDLGNISFSSTQLNLKISFQDLDSSKLDAQNTLLSKRYGFTQNIVGMEFTSNLTTGKFVVTGFKTQNRKYPILAERVSDGTSYKFSASHILKYLGGNKLINREANLKNLLD